METPPLPNSSAKVNKLIIRSEVLTVVRHLASLEDPPRQEITKQLKRLHDLNSTPDVLDVLVKELHRGPVGKSLHVVIEFLMELGTIETLQDKLWSIIRDPDTQDEFKDAANLVLRHLGDASDPDLYLDYLQDPQALIGRETVRMLEVSSENPEALIDFIDFISALRLEDQLRLLSALQEDYPSEYLANLYGPMLEAQPAHPEVWEQLILNMAQTRSPKAYTLLSRMAEWPQDKLPLPVKIISKAVKELQIAGAAQPQPPEEKHPMIAGTRPYQCFATVRDGVGNQGILFSLQRANGDIAMMSAALNDVHGVIDCFGFYQLSVGDFHKIAEKFHEGATKIKVTPGYCAFRLLEALIRNKAQCFRIPYEFSCWQPMLGGTDATAPKALLEYHQWARADWIAETVNLYQHPDFNSWFLEEEDMPQVTGVLQQTVMVVENWLQDDGADTENLYANLEQLADGLMGDLLESPWRELMADRLMDAAYLLDCQSTHTFRNLSATEAQKLMEEEDPKVLLSGFTRAYGRRCLLEELLRLRAESPDNTRLYDTVDLLIEHWQL